MDAVDRALRRSERRRAVLDIINITGATSARALKAKPALSPYPAIESVHEAEDKNDDKDKANMVKNLPYNTHLFLKGTMTKNPQNDLSQNYVATGDWPPNFIRNYEIDKRFKMHPKYDKLMVLKHALLAKRATPPMWLKSDLHNFDLRKLNMRFDVILIDPPVEEYARRAPGMIDSAAIWDWEDIIRLPLEDVAATPSFVFLWVGTGEGLENGRRAFTKWGYRRIEDICWLKTNKTTKGMPSNLTDPEAVLVRTKEHCLLGLKGKVARSNDTNFMHANCDVDVLIAEQAAYGSRDKPEEMYDHIERFCLGRRRLMLFGNDNYIRPGWLTVGPDLTTSNWNAERYAEFFKGSDGHLLGRDKDIEELRPKTPPHQQGPRRPGA